MFIVIVKFMQDGEYTGGEMHFGTFSKREAEEFCEQFLDEWSAYEDEYELHIRPLQGTRVPFEVEMGNGQEPMRSECYDIASRQIKVRSLRDMDESDTHKHFAKRHPGVRLATEVDHYRDHQRRINKLDHVHGFARKR